MIKISSIEIYSEKRSFKGTIEIECDKFNSLSEETQSLINHEESNHLQKLREQISMAWAKKNEVEERKKHVIELTELFKSAGFDTIYVETIDSEYCRESCCYKFPWIIVTTSKGRIKLGWRKSVMNLDWSDSDLDIDGEKMFKNENVTKGTSYIHCWSKEKTIEYLKKLNSKK